MRLKFLIVLLGICFPIAMMADLTQDQMEKMETGDQLFSHGEYQKAKEIFTGIYYDDNIVAGDPVLKSRIDNCDKCLKYISEGKEAERSGDYAKAISFYETAGAINPKDPNIPDYISQCRARQNAPYLAEARSLYSEGKYEEAQSKLDQYSSLSGQTDSDLLTKIISAKNLLDQGDSSLKNGDYKLAVDCYSKILEFLNPTDRNAMEMKVKAEKKLEETKYNNKDSANGTALALSLIPGVGLIQKGHKGEGAAYLVGDVALIGAGIGCTVYANRQKKIMNDRNNTVQQYNNAKNNFNLANTISYCCYGAAATIYIINLIRGYMAKPKAGAPIQWTVFTNSVPLPVGTGQYITFNVGLSYNF